MRSSGHVETVSVPARGEGAAARYRRLIGLMLAVLALCGCAEFGEMMGTCGDGTVDGLEQCDDGNNVDGDGCDASCGLETGVEILPTLASLQENVFTPLCAVCHRPGGTGPMPLDTAAASYENLVSVGLSWTCAVPRVDPGDPDGSCLVIKIEGAANASGTAMPPPPASPLSQDRIDAIRQWILDGALP